MIPHEIPIPARPAHKPAGIGQGLWVALVEKRARQKCRNNLSRASHIGDEGFGRLTEAAGDRGGYSGAVFRDLSQQG